MNLEDLTGLITTVLVIALYIFAARKPSSTEEEEGPSPKPVIRKAKIPSPPHLVKNELLPVKRQEIPKEVPQEPRIKGLIRHLKRRKDIALYYEIFKRRE